MADTWKLAIVEDSMDLCGGWKEVFEMDGHDVQCFLTGRDLLSKPEFLATRDLLITDYYLPDINGVDLLDQVRKHCPHLPVILLTGSKDVGIREALARRAATRLLHKPLGIDDLERAIGQILGEHGTTKKAV